MKCRTQPRRLAIFLQITRRLNSVFWVVWIKSTCLVTILAVAGQLDISSPLSPTSYTFTDLPTHSMLASSPSLVPVIRELASRKSLCLAQVRGADHITNSVGFSFGSHSNYRRSTLIPSMNRWDPIRKSNNGFAPTPRLKIIIKRQRNGNTLTKPKFNEKSFEFELNPGQSTKLNGWILKH